MTCGSVAGSIFRAVGITSGISRHHRLRDAAEAKTTSPGPRINDAGMVASDSFAEFVREQLAPLGHVELRRMLARRVCSATD